MDNIAKDSFIVKNVKYIWILLIIVAIFSSIILYFLGYRFKDNYTLGKSGTLTIDIPLPLTSVFIDNSDKIVTSKDNETISLTLSPKTHSVIVSREGYFPWTKDFVIPSKGNVALHPIFISQNATGQIITTKDPEYWSLRSKIIRDRVPNIKSPILSEDKSTSLWTDDNAIMIKNQNGTAKVIQPDDAINNVSFYKNRNDAVIFSIGNTIYAIETDTSSQQNFMPIYRGTNPLFIKTEPTFIYVLDGETLMQVII